MTSLFSGCTHSLLYSVFRFSPPPSLVRKVIDFLGEKINLPFHKAVDVGCGCGQSTIVLAPHFQTVIGLDVSETQIDLAVKSRGAPNVTYKVSDAYETGMKDCSVELVTVGQALHWFDLDKFYAEAKRILVPNGVLAVYGYWIPLPTIKGNKHKNKQFSDLIQNYLHDGVLGEHWDSRRYNVLRYSYQSINLPLQDVTKANFVLELTYTVSDYVGYLTSWSAYQKMHKEDSKKAEALMEDIQNRLMKITEADTPPNETSVLVCIDFFLHIGRKE